MNPLQMVLMAASRQLGGGGGDVTAPTLSSPVDTVTGSTTADLSVSTDEGTGTLYWVVSTSSTPPSAAQVKAGQMHTGAAAADSGSQAVSGTGIQSISGGADGLTADTAYFAHYMHEDAATNQSSAASGDGFTTYTSEAQTLFTAMTSAPDAPRKGHTNALIKGLKTDGIWSLLDILYVTAAHDAQAAGLNWKTPASFSLIAVNSPTFTADRGYAGNGTTARLRTQFTPSTNGVNVTQDSGSLWLWVRSNAQGAHEAGNTGASPFMLLNPRDATDVTRFSVNDGAASFTGGTHTDSAKFWGASRAASGTKKLWRNGVQFGSDVSVTSTGLSSIEQWICGANATNFGTRQISAAAWGSALTGLESALYNRLLTYMQAVGAA
jgi:hypothetical protein